MTRVLRRVVTWATVTLAAGLGSALASAQVVPPNDSCATRVSLSCRRDPQTVAGTTINATAALAPQCGSTAPGDHVVWYGISGNGGDIQIDTCSPATNFDTRINVYTGDCGNEAGLSCVAANDDAAGAPTECQLGGLDLLSRVSFTSVDGEEYLIAVSGFGEVSGDFELGVTCELPVVLLHLSVE